MRGVQTGYGFTRGLPIVVTLARALEIPPGRGFIISIGGVFWAILGLKSVRCGFVEYFSRLSGKCFIKR